MLGPTEEVQSAFELRAWVCGLATEMSLFKAITKDGLCMVCLCMQCRLVCTEPFQLLVAFTE